jgi:hypothetical protein
VDADADLSLRVCHPPSNDRPDYDPEAPPSVSIELDKSVELRF